MRAIPAAKPAQPVSLSERTSEQTGQPEIQPDRLLGPKWFQSCRTVRWFWTGPSERFQISRNGLQYCFPAKPDRLRQTGIFSTVDPVPPEPTPGLARFISNGDFSKN
jgi:hypothetical protein